MSTCGICGRSDLHEEYIELRGLGWRPVNHNPDGSVHHCLPEWHEHTPLPAHLKTPTATLERKPLMNIARRHPHEVGINRVKTDSL